MDRGLMLEKFISDRTQLRFGNEILTLGRPKQKQNN